VEARRFTTRTPAPSAASTIPISGTPVQPEWDRSPGSDSLCWVTGQGTNPNDIAQADVSGSNSVAAKTTLTSPAYDLTSMTLPTVAFWSWFYSQFQSPDDWLAILVSNDNGATWVPVDTLRGLRNAWEEHTVDVASYVTPSSQVRLRFVAADYGVNSVVEAGIDDIATYDATTPVVDIAHPWPPARLAFRSVTPNPARNDVLLALDVPGAGRVEAAVWDPAGRKITSLHDGAAAAGTLHLRWDGTDGASHPQAAGVYFVRARWEGATAVTRVVRVR
jgi:hypothetical protein